MDLVEDDIVRQGSHRPSLRHPGDRSLAPERPSALVRRGRGDLARVARASVAAFKPSVCAPAALTPWWRQGRRSIRDQESVAIAVKPGRSCERPIRNAQHGRIQDRVCLRELG
jgi:hypothetical protein